LATYLPDGPGAAETSRDDLRKIVGAFDGGMPAFIVKNRDDVDKHHDQHIAALGTLLNTISETRAHFATSQEDWWASTEQLAVSSQKIREYYVSRREALRAARKIGRLKPVEYSELREAIAELRTDLQALDRELARLPRELDGSFAGKLQARTDLEREAALGKALTGTAVPEHEGAEFAPYVHWVEDVEDLAGDFAGVERLLGQFYLLDEEPPGGDSPRELHDRGTARGVFEDVRAALTTVTERVDGLDAILGETDPAVLVRHTEDEARPELVHAAWRRLGEGEVEGWPAARAHLDREDRIRNALRELFRDAPEARKTYVEGKLSAERPKRWLACFRRLTEHQEIGDVKAQMKAFGVDLEALDPGLRFKHELHDFRAQLERVGTAAEDDEVAPVVESFIDGVTRRPSIAGAPGVAEILKKLREATQTEGGGGGKKTGPASMELVAPALRWTETPTVTGVLFAWNYQGREHSLEFIRLEAPPGQSKDFYLATTEVSVGLFRDVLLAAGEEEARKFDPEKGARDGRLPQKTARYGPCAWEWDNVTVRNRSEKDDVEPRNTRREMVGWWQNPDPPAIGENGVQVYDPFYVDPVTEPSTEHPMQHLPLPCASRFAVLLGCRLPTVAEWEKARSWQTSRNEEGAATAPANLRDAAWERQQAHFESFYDSLGRGASGTRLSAEEGIFQAQPAAGEERPEPVKEDGILWFRELEGRPGQFSDLVGNVAEFATWELLEPVELQGSGQPSRKTLDRFCIIGGSALSLPELWPETPHKILRLRDGKPDWSGARRGFSDVGLRLAFTAWRRPLIDRIAEVLEDDLYGLLSK
ncbi:MAG: SUMF1/EgtB/PvdO family nonheme iron enzyme, partial [Planctomycetota bacterium]|nr:SUMF1/EgtB/PvdO family nonheme iron enzyme [Planctomycetota bacterium]